MGKTKEKIRVEIVTPIFNRKLLTLQCLRSIAKVNSAELDIHTVIVDDGSPDGTSDAIRKQFPDVELVQGDGNLWFTEGTNVGIRAALKHNPKYVLLINDDQVFDEDSVRFMVETAEKYPNSIVGSLLLLWDEPHKLFQVSPRWETLSGGWRHWYQQTIWTIPEKPWEVDIVVGNCVLIPVEAIEKHGLMDSKRYPNFGDAEYTPRLKKKGYRLLIDPRARVFCQPNYVPASVTKMSLKEKFDALFVNLGHIHNLRRRFYSNIDAAPTKFHGIVAFVSFCLRLLTKNSIERTSWIESQIEKPLKEVFKDKIVSE